MPILNQQTYLSYYTSSLEPVRDENGNIISITSSVHPINEVSQFVERSSVYTYYSSSYLGQIFDFDFKELGVSSDEKASEPPVVPPGAIIISQSEYDYLVSTNSSLRIEVEQLNMITGSLYDTINYLETTIQYLLDTLGGGSASLNPTITTGQLPQGYINESYNATLNAVGGVPPFIWTVEGGSNQLPTGLSLNSTTGAINGIATQLYNANITFKVTDILGKYDYKAIGLIIKDPPPPPPPPLMDLEIRTSATLPDGFVSDYYEKQLVAQGGEGLYIWSLVPEYYLPTGISLSSAGLLYGTPTVATQPPGSSTTFKIKVIDSAVPFNQSTKTFTMKVVYGI